MSNLKYKHTAYTSAQWASLNPVIVENEIVIESDTKRTKIGNGISTYNELEYADANSVGNSLGSIKPTDAAPTPARNGNYTFSVGGNKPAWLTAEPLVTEVKAGDGVSVVYTAPSGYSYTHVDINSVTLTRGWWLKNPYQNKINGFDAVVNAVIDISLVGCDVTKSYSISTLCKNHPTYKNKIIIYENNVKIAEPLLLDVDASGIKRVSVASGDKKIYLTINYDLLNDGFIFNTPTAANWIYISELCHVNTELALKSKIYSIDQIHAMFDFQNKNYLVDIKKVIDISQTTNRQAFAGVLDIWFENLSSSIYANYEFCVVFIGRNDATFKDILWFGRRANSGAAWEYKTVASGTTTYFPLTNDLLKKSTIWDGVTINIVVNPFLLPTTYKDVTGVLLKKTEAPNNDLSRTFNELNKQIASNTTAIASNTTAIASNTTHVDNILGKGQQTPNYSYGYPYVLGRPEGYYPGHTVSTDIGTTTDAPVNSGISTKCSKVVAFSLNTGNSSYYYGPFQVNTLALLQSYNIADGIPITPVKMKCKIHNSHATASATVNSGFRSKKNTNWYLPSQTITLLPGETKEVSVDFVINAGEDWSIINTNFDIYGYINSSALEADPCWIYFGDMDMWFLDPKGRVQRPVIAGKSIIGGISESQLDDSLKSKISAPLVPTKRNIIASGSSITWGDGGLDSSFVAFVEEYIRTKLSTTILTNNMIFSETPTTFTNSKQYKSEGKKLTGINKKVSFSIEGDELVICQTKLRTLNYGKMQVKADGIVIGSFDNINSTIGSSSESFTGNGTNVKFALSRPCTYNHSVSVNGVTKVTQINSGGYGGTFPVGVDVLVIRKLDSAGEPIHVLWFASAPPNGSTISVSYDYGRIITHERSLRGQTTDDSINESAYGDGNTSFDPANPSSLSSGMEFRAIDENAMFIHKFLSIAKREIEIEIVGGTNPYFIINYATNRFHNLMNAGIGGWTVGALINNDKVNDFNSFFQYFIPDLIYQESATNDDWAYGARKVQRTVTGLTESQVKRFCTLELYSVSYQSGSNTYNVVSNTGLISSITKFSLICPQVIGSSVVPGDIIRIGNYKGDNKQVACRKVDTVNLTTGEVTWIDPLNSGNMMNINSLSDLVGSEISIRNLDGYKSNYETLIQSIQKISPHAKILIVQPGLSNYYQRQLWGYEIIHRDIAKLYYNVDTVEITDWLYDFQKGYISGLNYTEITANDSDFYDLPWTGHWQGFRVLINGIDVYGKSCYIESGSLYTVAQNLSGASLDYSGNYKRDISTTRPMRLVFLNNKPATGTIRIERANSVWSSDFCHPNDDGNYVYGQAYNSSLNNLIS